MKRFLFPAILLLAFALRVLFLGSVPQGVTHDELGYIFNAYSISKTGMNVFGEMTPLFTWMVVGGFPFLPVPIYIGAIFFSFLPFSVFAGRLPSALLGTADVFLLYILVNQLFKNRALSLLSALFLAVSPWHLHFSRSAYDPNFSLFFYLLAAVVFFYEAEKKRIPIFSSLALLFAVFSYRGMSPVFLPFSCLLLWYGIRAYKLPLRSVLQRIVGIGIVLFLFLAAIVFFGKSYTQEALFFNDPKIQEAVNKEIREAEGPLFIRRIFLNKPTYITAKLRENYLRGYSTEYLFLYTEPHRIYSIWSRGRVYALDLLFVIAGAIFLFSQKSRSAAVIIGAVLIGGIPGLLGGMPYSARNYLIAAFLPVLTAGGVVGLAHLFKSKVAKIIFVVLIIVFYSYSVAGYLFDYYARYSHQAAESWAKSLKDVSLFVGDNAHLYDKVVIGNTSFGDVLQYALYNNIAPSDVQDSWRGRAMQNDRGEYVLGKVIFKSGCDVFEDKTMRKIPEMPDDTLLIVRSDCTKTYSPDKVIKDYYGNTVWKIYSLNKN